MLLTFFGFLAAAVVVLASVETRLAFAAAAEDVIMVNVRFCVHFLKSAAAMPAFNFGEFWRHATLMPMTLVQIQSECKRANQKPRP
jgi:hypothetical protein